MTKESRRGRPRSFDPDTAVGIAQALFQQNGYAGVSTAMVCAALGIAPPSLYAAFGSKAQLFGRVVERYLATEGAFMAGAFAQPDLALMIQRLLEGAASSYATREGSAGCLIMNGVGPGDDAAARAIIATVRLDVRRQLVTALARHLPDRADEIADLIGMALAGMSAAALGGADREGLNRFATLISRGIRDACGLAVSVTPSGV